MQKYLTFIRLGFLDSIAWRGNVVYWVIIDIVSTAIVPFLWIAVIRAEGKPIVGYDIANIITYFVGICLIWQCVITYPFWYIIRDVRDGMLANALVRPYSYFGALIAYNIGSRAIRAIITLPLIGIILIPLRSYIVVPQSLVQISMLALSIVVAFYLIYLLHFIVGMIAFWFEEGFAVANMFMYTFYIFSGDSAPIVLLPNWLQGVANTLPFQYVLNFPLQIYLGKIDPQQFLTQLIFALAWCIGLYMVYRVLWAMGLRQFTGVGR